MAALGIGALILFVVAGLLIAAQWLLPAQSMPELVAALPTLTVSASPGPSRPAPNASALVGTNTPGSPGPASSAATGTSTHALTHTPGALEPARTLTQLAGRPTPTRPAPTRANTSVPTHPPTGTPTGTPEPTATPTHTPEPTLTLTPTPTHTLSPTATPTATPPPLAVLNDQACLRPETGQLYIYGELANQGAEPFDVDRLNARVFGPSGEINVAGQSFDLPGNYYVAANSRLPFELVVQLGTAQYDRYQIDVVGAPGAHTPRADLSLGEVVVEAEGDGLTGISGRWMHTGPPPETFVSIIATVYNADGRVANMDYLYMTSIISLDPQLPPGQYRFEDLFLSASPCGEGAITMSIIGE